MLCVEPNDQKKMAKVSGACALGASRDDSTQSIQVASANALPANQRARAQNKTARTVATQGARSRPASKKAYVRFDDYLDLNEENMRRSCKKIMNKLYCEPAARVSNQTAVALPVPASTTEAAICRPKLSPPPPPSSLLLMPQRPHNRQQTSGAPKSASQSPVGASALDLCGGAQLKGQRATKTGADKFANSSTGHVASSSPNLQVAEKSYLRLQYERRQRRQLELFVSKMPEPTQAAAQQDGGPQMVMNFNLADVRAFVEGGAELTKLNQDDNGQTHVKKSSIGGASNNNICLKQQQKQKRRQQQQQQHQQDLVAKSHELSKRRFFEKLERRESLKTKKNLEILGTQSGHSQAALLAQVQPVSSAANRVQLGPGRAAQSANEAGGRQIFQAPVGHRDSTPLEARPLPLVAASSSATSERPHALNQGNGDQDDHMIALQSQPTSCDTLEESSGPASKWMMPPSSCRPAPLTKLNAASVGPAAEPSRWFHKPLSAANQQQEQQRSELVTTEKSKETVENNRNKPAQVASLLAGDQPSRLIEFLPAELAASVSWQDASHLESEAHSVLDNSAFEIKVPPTSSGSHFARYGQANGRAPSCDVEGVLVVKQVEEATCQTGDSLINDPDSSSFRRDKSFSKLPQGESAGLGKPASSECDKERSAANATQVQNNEMIEGPSSSAAPGGGNEIETVFDDDDDYDARDEHKREAASAQLAVDNNDATRQVGETIKVQSSDNRQAGEGGERAEKVISASISMERVNQDQAEGGELWFHDADKIKKEVAERESWSTSSARTTSKQAADKRRTNSGESGERAPFAKDTLQLALEVEVEVEVEASKSRHHARPEIKEATQSAASENNGHHQRRIDNFNEPIALRQPTQLEAGTCAAQAKQQQQVQPKQKSSSGMAAAAAVTAPAASANTRGNGDGGVDEAAAAGRGGGGGGRSALVFEPEEEEANEATSLETIITNRPSARDVLPEANAKMLNRQIGSEAGASACSSLHSARGDAAEKVALQVEVNDFGHDFERRARGPAASFECDEQANDNHDPCERGQQKRHLSEPLVERLPLQLDYGQRAAFKEPTQQYANGASNHDHGAGGEHSQESPANACENIHLGSSEACDTTSAGLIEPLYGELGKSSSRNLQTSRMQTTIEEDIRSSCSSSGFGASVRATSSSSSTESSSSSSSPHHHIDHLHRHHNNNNNNNNNNHQYHSFKERRPSASNATRRQSSALAQQKGEQIYDVVRPLGASRNLLIARNADSIQIEHHDDQDAINDETYKLVGPDQAYPSKKGRPMLIENHGYASLVNRAQLDIAGHDGASQSMEFYLSEQYANLPGGKMPLQCNQSSSGAEYATVRAPSMRFAGESGRSLNMRMPSAENKSHSSSLGEEDEDRRISSGSSEIDCDSSFGRRNGSLSSANSGGFSKLPPVRFIDRNIADPQHQAPSIATNDEDSNGQQRARKSASLLKRFGSLVSRAFSSNAPDDGQQQQQQRSESIGSASIRNMSAAPAAAQSSGDLSSSAGAVLNEAASKQASRGEATSKTSVVTGGRQAQAPPSNALAAGGALAEADLVILPAKNNPPKDSGANLAAAGPQKHKTQEVASARGRCAKEPPTTYRSHDLRRLAPGELELKRRLNRSSRSISISSLDSSSNSNASLEYMSLISAPFYRTRRRDKMAPWSNAGRCSDSSHPRRSSSLSDELESLMSRSEFEWLRKWKREAKTTTTKRQAQKPAQVAVKAGNKSARARISIDCVSPPAICQLDAAVERVKTRTKIKGAADISIGRSRSLLRWLGSSSGGGGGGGANSTHSLVSPAPAPAPPRADKLAGQTAPRCTSGARCDSNRLIKMATHDLSEAARRHYSMNGFLSLMDDGHANIDYNRSERARVAPKQAARRARHSTAVGEQKEEPSSSSSLIYAKVLKQKQQKATASSGKMNSRQKSAQTSASKESDDSCERDDACELEAKCQSLNIYQSLMRNYLKRSHDRRHHRSNHDHRRHHQPSTNYHHRDHHQKQRSCGQSGGTARHSHTATAANRCGAQCALPSAQTGADWEKISAAGARCSVSSPATENKNFRDGDKSGVWGQLIKINKSDGSQVIELQRAPAKSWGFFVARGAINSVKGIFISRMHDSVTSNSLAGLLSIGDRILSIDGSSIGPDFDILRVNQMISKKSKISLKIKPYKA